MRWGGGFWRVGCGNGKNGSTPLPSADRVYTRSRRGPKTEGGLYLWGKIVDPPARGLRGFFRSRLEPVSANPTYPATIPVELQSVASRLKHVYSNGKL